MTVPKNTNNFQLNIYSYEKTKKSDPSRLNGANTREVCWVQDPKAPEFSIFLFIYFCRVGDLAPRYAISSNPPLPRPS